jgi:hypothetical protein
VTRRTPATAAVADSDDVVVELVRRTAASSGVPEHIEDPGVLAEIVNALET